MRHRLLGAHVKCPYRAKIKPPLEVVVADYKLKTKALYGVWSGENVLYISDEKPPLRAKERDGIIFEPSIDVNNRLSVPSKLEDCNVEIVGRISTIEISFKKR